MKKFESNELLDQLQSDVRELIVAAAWLRKEDPGVLLEQPDAGKWSVIQVLEHLNSYGRYYLPAIEKALRKFRNPTSYFIAGWLGDYFTRLMAPKEGQVVNKMKAPRGHRPDFHADAKPVLDEFVQQQQKLLDLLELARERNIGALRVPTSLSKLIRLKLGDTFRFLVAHEQRHFVQVRRTLDAVKQATGIFQEDRRVA